jgi:hypothetical protein
MLRASVQLLWLPLPDGEGAMRIADGVRWYRARKCRRCFQLGYDYGDALARIEAENLDVWTSVRVVSCVRCGEPVCTPLTSGGDERKD